MRHPLILDLETKYTFRQQPDPKNLKVSIVGIYDYQDERFKSFFEEELPKLFSLLEHASHIIGFNIDNFDFPVLQGYYRGNIFQLKTFDILEDIRKIIGRRVALNDIVKETLGKKKSGHGLAAIHLFEEGKLEELKQYCLDDVSLTKEIFEYGVKHKEIFYPNHAGKEAIKVNWEKHWQDRSGGDVSLTLPF